MNVCHQTKDSRDVKSSMLVTSFFTSNWCCTCYCLETILFEQGNMFSRSMLYELETHAQFCIDLFLRDGQSFSKMKPLTKERHVLHTIRVYGVFYT